LNYSALANAWSLSSLAFLISWNFYVIWAAILLPFFI
jgi:hypothetical protein